MRAAMLCLGLMLVGCAGVNGNGPASASASASASGETRWETCFPGRRLGEEEGARVLQMRDDGASYQEIGRVVGPAPQSLRCWTARVRGRNLEAPQIARMTRK